MRAGVRASPRAPAPSFFMSRKDNADLAGQLFGVRHYAGEVIYHAAHLVDRNRELARIRSDFSMTPQLRSPAVTGSCF